MLVLTLLLISLQFNSSLLTENMVASKVIVFLAFAIILCDEIFALNTNLRGGWQEPFIPVRDGDHKGKVRILRVESLRHFKSEWLFPRSKKHLSYISWIKINLIKVRNSTLKFIEFIKIKGNRFWKCFNQINMYQLSLRKSKYFVVVVPFIFCILVHYYETFLLGHKDLLL